MLARAYVISIDPDSLSLGSGHPVLPWLRPDALPYEVPDPFSAIRVFGPGTACIFKMGL